MTPMVMNGVGGGVDSFEAYAGSSYAMSSSQSGLSVPVTGTMSTLESLFERTVSDMDGLLSKSPARSSTFGLSNKTTPASGIMVTFCPAFGSIVVSTGSASVLGLVADVVVVVTLLVAFLVVLVSSVVFIVVVLVMVVVVLVVVVVVDVVVVDVFVVVVVDVVLVATGNVAVLPEKYDDKQVR